MAWNEEPKVYKENKFLLKPSTISLSATETSNRLKNVLNDLVVEDFVDFSYNENHQFSFEGRIYQHYDVAEFFIEILRMEDQRNENECLLEIRRMEGDGFIFHDFKNKLLKRLGDFVENNHDHNENIFNENKNKLNFVNEDEEEQTIENNHDNKSEDEDEDEKYDKYETLVKNAVNTSNYREILKDDVISLLNVVKNKNKIKHITKINNVFSLLLKPFLCHPQDAILDTFILKTLLEIILLLIEECRATIWKDNQDDTLIEELQTCIQSVKIKWSHNVVHPLQIAVIPQSQQIVRVCESCLSQM